MDIEALAQRSHRIRTAYHQLEQQQDGHPWTLEQDALAFLTDAGLVGRQVMNQTNSWPETPASVDLASKLAESIWWLVVLADRSGIDIDQALTQFLTAREQHLS
ncbi:MazG-like protein [Lactobacillus sp. CBA3605]|uniref:MazG-like protein n=1 Tax=Lactobacillus sp. CBA3605 TaxID=2099788 RepID=UPI000CFC1F16|nr:MazG-like protein [Lactobacillus sp. CBA3605]AVK61120.1 MazG-like protein [Lactobacillus sp. CBA3605]